MKCPDPINRKSSVTQTDFNGKNICMNNAGKRPVDLVQPTEAGCPTGYSPCSSNTANWWDLVCFKDNEDPSTACPIISVNFASINDLQTYNDAQWQKILLTSSIGLVFTKTDS